MVKMPPCTLMYSCISVCAHGCPCTCALLPTATRCMHACAGTHPRTTPDPAYPCTPPLRNLTSTQALLRRPAYRHPPVRTQGSEVQRWDSPRVQGQPARGIRRPGPRQPPALPTRALVCAAGRARPARSSGLGGCGGSRHGPPAAPRGGWGAETAADALPRRGGDGAEWSKHGVTAFLRLLR